MHGKQFLLACALGAGSLLSVYGVAFTDSEHNALMRAGQELRAGGAYAVEHGYPAVSLVVSAREALEAVRARNVLAKGSYMPAAPDGQASLEALLAQGRFALGFLPLGRFPRPELQGLIEELDGLAEYMAGNNVSGEESGEVLEYVTGRIWESAAPDKFKIVGYSLFGILSLLSAGQSAAAAFRRSRNPSV